MDLNTLSHLQTEASNPQTRHIDQLSTLDMCKLINTEDHRVAASLTPCLPQIAGAIDALTPRVRRGGRVIYVGAGTSGRLGILDASEIPPTFAAPPGQFIGLIAGGDAAIRRAQEGAEDNIALGETDMAALDLDPELDSVIGIAASGRTPYVLGCISFAKGVGCVTIGVVCAEPSALGASGDMDFLIAPLPGPEVISGSTRLKAGTATKLVLNMLSTGTMIRVGKTFGNTMVDLIASNAKLRQRSRNIFRRFNADFDSFSNEDIDALLTRCDGSVKLALLVAETGRSVGECRQDLEACNQQLSKALAKVKLAIIGSEYSNGREKRLVLCVDGGGTKCAAVVADQTGAALGRGEAGPCNITDGTCLDTPMRTLSTAVQGALQNAQISSPNQNILSRFESAWIGLAGMDRPGLRGKTESKITAILGQPSRLLRLSNDVDLLSAVMARHPDTSSVTVLIAGTGSIAMRYSAESGKEPTRTARSGGWGHLLGDEGGGYSIGLDAVKHTLKVCEEVRLGLRPDEPEFGQLEQAILQHFSLSKSRDMDLLSEVLSGQDGESVKMRIAAVAQPVLDLAVTDTTAMGIASSQAKALVDTVLGRLIDPRSSTVLPPEKTGLVLSGGVLMQETYRELVLEQLAGKGIKFAYVEVVSNAGALGAQSLASLEAQQIE